MGREMVQTAAKLLAKAQSTTSDHEAIALVERSYRLLAKAINDYDAQYDNGAGSPRRRERRRLHERRRRARAERSAASEETAPAGQVDSIARYRGTADGGSWRRGIDVRL
jgi:hypothetical protein